MGGWVVAGGGQPANGGRPGALAGVVPECTGGIELNGFGHSHWKSLIVGPCFLDFCWVLGAHLNPLPSVAPLCSDAALHCAAGSGGRQAESPREREEWSPHLLPVGPASRDGAVVDSVFHGFHHHL